MRRRQSFLSAFVLILSTTFLALPLLANPTLFLDRGNDLQLFFKPLLIFTKNQILTNHVFPLWNPLWFGGMPLVSDPQTPLSYPLNLLFLFGDINKILVVTIFIHLFLSLLWMYLFLKKIQVNDKSAVVGALLYAMTTRYAAAFEAGHLGILYALAWIPAVMYFLVMIKDDKSMLSIIGLSLSSWFLFAGHQITATLFFPVFYFFAFLSTSKKTVFVKRTTIALFLSFCFLAPFLLPELVWQAHTSRELLVKNPQTYPQWSGKKEFIETLFVAPIKFDTEKQITIGFAPVVIAIGGLMILKRKHKYFAVVLLFTVLLVASNNASPVYNVLTKLSFFNKLRVATRVWVLVAAGVPVLCAIFLSRIKKHFLFVILSALLLTNAALLYFSIISHKPAIREEIGGSIYDNFDPKYRVYCATQCLDTEVLADKEVGSINGYATLIPWNFFTKSWGLFGGYWDYYTLALPPFGASKTQKLRPDLKALGEYNVKYIVSDTGEIVKNELARGEAYATDDSDKEYQTLPVSYKDANTLRVDTSQTTLPYLVLSNTYSTGWKATDDTGKHLMVSENPSSLIQTDLPGHTKFIEFSYRPVQHLIGVAFLAGAAIILLSFIVFILFFGN